MSLDPLDAIKVLIKSTRTFLLVVLVFEMVVAVLATVLRRPDFAIEAAGIGVMVGAGVWLLDWLQKDL